MNTSNTNRNRDTLKELMGMLEQRDAELTIISNVQQGLSENMELQEIYEMVGEQIRDLFDAQVTSIATFDNDYQTETFRYLFENGKRVYPDPRPIDKIRQRLIDTRELIHFAENAQEAYTEITGEEAKAVPGTDFPKSVVVVPLTLGNSVRGYVSLQNLDREHAFSDDDIRLLSTLANSMSVALENARLFSETEQRNAELAVINSVQEGLVAEMDMQGIYDLVGDRIRELFDAQVTGIYTFDQDAGLEHFQYLFEDGERLYPESRPLNEIRKWIINNASALHIDENADDKIYEITKEKHEPVPGTRLPKSLIFVPLTVGDKVKGCVSLQNLDREHAFSDSDVRLLSTLANSMSVALENARLFNETEQRNAELAVINSVQQGLVAEMDMQGIYELVGERIRNLFDAQVAVISTFDNENHKENFQYCFEDGERIYPEPREIDKFRQRLIDTQSLICINEDADEVWKTITGEEPTVVPGTKLTKSALYVPMVVGNSVRGYVSLQNVDREHAFSDSDVRLLSTLTNSMSVALENARLFNETEQRNAELAVINSVQQGLVAEMDMQGIYDLVGDRIRELFDAQVAAIATFDHEYQTETFRYLFENGGRLYPKPRKYDKIRQRLINTNNMINIQENAGEAYTTITGAPPTAVPGTGFPKSMVFVPLSIGDTVRGYVSLQNLDREHAFSESDVRLLRTLANSMSVALENARLFNETEQRNAELAVINSVQEGLVAEMDMQGIYDLVGERIRNLFDAQVTGIVTFNHDNNTEIFKYLFEDGDRLYPSSRPYDKVREKIINDRTTLLFNENAAAELSRILGQPHKPVPGTRAAKSALYVPMLVGDKVRGYVTLQNLDRDHAFTESDVRLLNTLVNSMSVALENARLFNETTRLLAETEQRNAELAVINSVQEGLVREMDMEAIYSLVGDRICNVLNTQTLVIRTFDHEKSIEHWEYVIENGERFYNEPRPFIWANEYLIEKKEHLLINEDYIETARKFGDTEQGVSKGLPPKSAIFVPMIVGDEVIGSVSLQNVEQENAFNESDVRLLTTLTNSMSVALENARLFNETNRLLAETEQRASELQTVNNISRALVSQLEFDALIELVGEQMRETFKADIVYLALYERENDMLHFPYYYGDKNAKKSKPFGNGLTEKIITDKAPLLINHDLEEAYDRIKAEKIGKWVESYLGVPIITGNKAIGVISVQSTEEKNRFTEYDQRLLSTIAANVGVAMQNAEAYENLQEALTELKAAQEQLVQQEKLASLGQLTAGIAHEIKNPLNFVNNFSDVSIELVQEIRDEISGLEASDITEEVGFILTDVEANLKKILEHGKRADGIVKSMLLHSRGKSGERIPTDLNKLIDEYVKLAYHGMRAVNKSFNIDIQTDYDDSIGIIDLVAQDLSRAFLNVINNAMYAAYEYCSSTKERNPIIKVSTEDLGSRIRIGIRDNGPGIPVEIREKIFEPFFTTKPTGEGTGLGLSMTYDIINLHNGTLQIESEPGSYTEFLISLPKTMAKDSRNAVA